VDYIKGKPTNKTNKCAKKSSKVLKITHIDICGPFSAYCLNYHRYFISFIDNHTRYMYLYLLFSKSRTLDAIKTYKKEIKRQLRKKINILRSYKDSEYYGRYIEFEKRKGFICKLLGRKGYHFIIYHARNTLPE